jgi:uncharacterized protein YndB with AHSA1/START domain
MPNILHRLTIDAPPQRVSELIATSAGLESWWTGRPVGGDDQAGGQLAFYFSDSETPAATFAVVEREPERIVWRCVDGPDSWVDTRVTYALSARDDGGTTMLFSHAGWREESEFMHGCSTNWAAFLIGLKSGAEGGDFAAYPAGEISRWS